MLDAREVSVMELEGLISTKTCEKGAYYYDQGMDCLSEIILLVGTASYAFMLVITLPCHSAILGYCHHTPANSAERETGCP